MSDYNKSTNFTTKDTLPSGNSQKIVKGTELDVEFTNIASAVASKANSDSPNLTGTPTAPTAILGTNTTQIASCAFVKITADASFPSGGIIIWSGAISAVPTGWVLCNGSNGTPDLRNRFVVGAGSTYAVGAAGGSTDATLPSHTHGVSDPSHSHGISDPGHAHGGWFGAYAPDDGSQGGGGRPGPKGDGRTTNSATTGISVNGATTGISIQYSGGSATNANLPPYYALAYIMKS